jgi:CDP-diacylglycerol--serine O-phosphatidyltransferase
MPPPEPKPPILASLHDAANLLTLAGVFSSLLAITFAFTGKLSQAAIGLLAAFIFDVIDGPVAKRLKGRTTTDQAIGANLDSLADVISAGVTLAVVFLAYGNFQPQYIPGAFCLVAAATLRLAYFNVHGLTDTSTTYTGLPTDLAIITFTTVLLLDQPLTHNTFQIVLYTTTLTIAALMVSTLPFPKLTGKPFYTIIALALALTLTLTHTAIALT